MTHTSQKKQLGSGDKMVQSTAFLNLVPRVPPLFRGWGRGGGGGGGGEGAPPKNGEILGTRLVFLSSLRK